MTTPHNVLTFGRRRSYQEAAHEQRDCPHVRTLQQNLEDTVQGLKAGLSPAEIRIFHGAQFRAKIRNLGEGLAACETPSAAAVFLRHLASELEKDDPF